MVSSFATFIDLSERKGRGILALSDELSVLFQIDRISVNSFAGTDNIPLGSAYNIVLSSSSNAPLDPVVESEIKAIFAGSSSLESFLEICERKFVFVETRSEIPRKKSMETFIRAKNQLDEISWQNVTSAADTLASVTFSFPGEFEFQATINLDKVVTVVHDIPCPWIDLAEPCKDPKPIVSIYLYLKDLVKCPFVKVIAKSLSEIDEKCLVIKDGFSEDRLSRCIALDHSSYLIIRYNACCRDKAIIPALEIMGSSKGSFQGALANLSAKWDTHGSVVLNIIALFGLHEKGLPGPAHLTESSKEECGICFGDFISESQISCSNTLCPKVFHSSCLEEWLRDLPDSRMSLGYIFGSCPVCSQSVSLRTK